METSRVASVPKPMSPRSSFPSPATPNHQLTKSHFLCLSKKLKQGVDEQIGNRLLITIYVMGSPGPLKMVVSEDESVDEVIVSTLKLYSRVRRLPILGSNSSLFDLHCTNSGSGPFDGRREVGSCGSRSFLLCKKPTAFLVNQEEKPASGGGRICNLQMMRCSVLGLVSCLSLTQSLP